MESMKEPRFTANSAIGLDSKLITAWNRSFDTNTGYGQLHYESTVQLHRARKKMKFDFGRRIIIGSVPLGLA